MLNNTILKKYFTTQNKFLKQNFSQNKNNSYEMKSKTARTKIEQVSFIFLLKCIYVYL